MKSIEDILKSWAIDEQCCGEATMHNAVHAMKELRIQTVKQIASDMVSCLVHSSLSIDDYAKQLQEIVKIEEELCETEKKKKTSQEVREMLSSWAADIERREHECIMLVGARCGVCSRCVEVAQNVKFEPIYDSIEDNPEYKPELWGYKKGDRVRLIEDYSVGKCSRPVGLEGTIDNVWNFYEHSLTVRFDGFDTSTNFKKDTISKIEKVGLTTKWKNALGNERYEASVQAATKEMKRLNKCECGVDSVGGGMHSSWCPKAKC